MTKSLDLDLKKRQNPRKLTQSVLYHPIGDPFGENARGAIDIGTA
jgi:hypothetical protein